jgi:CHASE2 domain-containing sensor protein
MTWLQKNGAKIRGQIRHILGALGVYLVGVGVFDQAVWDEVAGAAMTLVAFGLSWVSPDKELGKGDL